MDTSRIGGSPTENLSIYNHSLQRFFLKLEYHKSRKWKLHVFAVLVKISASPWVNNTSYVKLKLFLYRNSFKYVTYLRFLRTHAIKSIECITFVGSANYLIA